MKKMIWVVLAALMLSALFAGCGTPPADDVLPGNSNAPAERTSDTPAEEPANTPSGAPADVPTANSVSGGGTVSEAYSAYVAAKGNVITKISDGLSSNPDTTMTALSFLGVAMIDLALLPVSFFGMGQESVEAGLAMMGATGAQYTEDGDAYTITYTDEEGKTYVYAGTYDAAADALVCTATADGAESIYSEYRKTSFGYAGQYYFLNDDGTASLYQIAVKGENGTVGISDAASKPAALTGGEAADFPVSSTEWYSINGTTITGVTSDGTQLNFEYTPTATE